MYSREASFLEEGGRQADKVGGGGEQELLGPLHRGGQEGDHWEHVLRAGEG